LRYDGWNLLLDAGEDVQRRIEPFGTNKRMAIFISHMHADHCLGLPGLLLRYSLLGRTTPLEIFGPKSIIDWVKVAQDTINLGTTFSCRVVGLDEGGVLFTEGSASIRAFEVDHRGFALGYEFTYQRPTGKFLPKAAAEYGVPKGPLWRKLASGEAVVLEDGTQVRPDQVSNPPAKGIKIVYSGDTRPCDAVREAAIGADVLVHEAMYTQEHSDLAAERGHTTAKDAASIAKQAGVGLLVLTHYSPRYNDGEPILEEAKGVFSNTVLARDMMRVSIGSDGEREVVYPDS
jgi:ribonuclease Z